MKHFAIFKILLCVFLFSLSVSAKTRLSLGQGAMSAGGHIDMPIVVPKEGKTIVGLRVSPTFSYFVSHSFALGFSPSIERTSLTAENAPWEFSLALSGIYYFDLGGPLYPYAGGGGGMTWKTKVEGINFNLMAPVGMLIALNSSVAIDFGVPLTFQFTKDGYLGAILPVGYLGVRAFF